MNPDNSKCGAGNLPLIIGIAVIGGIFGFLYASSLIPQAVSTALILALVFGLLAKTSLSSASSEVELPTMDSAHGATAEEIASAVSSAVSQLLANSRDELASLDAGLQKTSNAMQSSLDSSTAKLTQALGEHSEALTSGGSEWKGQLEEAFASHGTVLESGASAIAAAGSGWQGDVAKMLETHAAKIEAASLGMSTNFERVSDELAKQMNHATNDLAKKLDEIGHLASNIDSVLQATQAANEAIQSVTNANEFKETLNSFRESVTESQALLKKASRPKSFRFEEA